MRPKFHFKGRSEDREERSRWVNDSMGEKYRGKKALLFQVLQGPYYTDG